MAVRNLRNKQVLITGAGSGIGRASALAFAKRGAHIVASDIHPAPLETLKREVESLGVACLTYVVDVSNEAAMQEFAAQVHGKVGAIDVLLNNAGIAYLGLFLQSDLAHWRRVMDINVMGVVHGCRYFIPHMLAAGGARQVLNVASSAGNYPAPSMAAYAASKYAVAGFSEVLKMELHDTQIGVTTVCPGVINTAITTTGSQVAASFPESQIAKLRAYYQRKGCDPSVVAEDIVRATQKGQDICLTGPGAALAYHVKRISVGLVRFVTIKAAKVIGYL
ncbi:MAG: SDR family NAD(P)-dependent oxidoreductase [Burkholderiaceae bacterium]|nr:SDR family NAD(P)-dependent oxidoreductase [Burkholderiaceae bacterium]